MTTICIDCRYIETRPSGVAEVVRGLIEHAPELAPDLTFLLLRHPSVQGRLSAASNVREIVVPQPANGPATMWWLPRVVDLSGVHLFHATFNILPAGLKMPCVTTIHDIMWLTHPGWCNPSLFGRVERAFYAHGIMRALQRSAAVATVSGATRDEILAWMPAAAGRTFATPSGVSKEFHPVRPNPVTLAALGLRPGKKFVLTVGQYAPYKNHEGALRAFSLAFRNQAEFDLVFVQRRGGGAEHLQQLADKLGLGGRVHMLRAIGRGDLVQLYSAATALLHPSFCEGFGNPLAEAMACGCPVITSTVSAMPEVTNGAARLADPHDPAAIAAALKRTVDNPVETGSMRERGLARAKELSWQAYAAANLAVYRTVLSGPLRSGGGCDPRPRAGSSASA